MTITKTLGAVATLALLTAAVPAYAQANSSANPLDATDQLLLRLKEKGILSDEEYDALLKLKQQQPAPATATALPVAAPPPQQAAAEPLDRSRLVTMSKSGVGMQLGDVTLTFSGSINGFYAHDSGTAPGPNTNVVGGLATVGGNTSAVRNGLLPGFLKVDVTTQQGGWDIGAHFGLYPGINSVTGAGGANSGGNPQALATSGIDARETYLTFGKANFGTVTIGRAIGLFGQDAILNDITLLSVGTAAGNAAPSNTSLGRIGVGYIYTDFQPQITYSTPDLNGFKIAAGIFMPLNTFGAQEVNGTPGFQARLSYDGKFGDVGVHAWLSGITQDHNPVGGVSYTGRGLDFGTKLSVGGASLLGYYYTGQGLGTTGLFILSTDAAGRARGSNGYYLQGTYTAGKFTVGASYGESRLNLTPGEVNPELLRSNSSYVGQLRYGLTSWVTLIGEYTHSMSRAHGGNRANSDTLAAGAILFF
ncbi:porin [Sandarakinorhabdus sp.]|uniref:porin n=1 Tax=Sandarakinorhabdus sp. TaxID=1916663 RepID=UPI003F728E2A